MIDPFVESKKYFHSELQQFQQFDKYSRYNYDLGRRESWVETVDRTVDFLRELSNGKLDESYYKEMRDMILNLEVLPSMRLLAMAGDAARRSNVAIYNCSFLGIDSIEAMVEVMIISMNGCGVGYSVEKRHVNKLPLLAEEIRETEDVFLIPDDSEGWAEAIRQHVTNLFDGKLINFDYSQLRPEGAVLKVKGGRSSGPKVLKNTLDGITRVFLQNYHAFNNDDNMFFAWLHPGVQRLTTLNVHDIVTLIGDCSISGGTRRTAMIALFDMQDDLMLNSKKGKFPENRYNANNSVVWDEEINFKDFLKHMSALFGGNNGEPGIFNRFHIKNQIPARREFNEDFGTNPCGEIILRNMQFCNLSAVVARENDTLDELAQKVRVATLIGTIQAMATYFPGLRPEWEKNAKEEALLGVDITGQRDCKILNHIGDNTANALEYLRHVAVSYNKMFAEKLGINQAAAVTCGKPSGNSSVLVNSSSGIHARPFRHYLRNVIITHTSPIYSLYSHSGVPMTRINDQQSLVHFPIKAPEGSTVEEELCALDQLEYWGQVKYSYTEHNPSVTIKYRESEVLDIIYWLWKNRAEIGGLTFLPISNADYDYMPIERISQEEYEKRISEFPQVDWALLQFYEGHDQTSASQELACVSGYCDAPFNPEDLQIQYHITPNGKNGKVKIPLGEGKPIGASY